MNVHDTELTVSSIPTDLPKAQYRPIITRKWRVSDGKVGRKSKRTGVILPDGSIEWR